MAISWLTALKAVPWTDLVQAAPQIVKGARSLFATVRKGAPAGDAKQPAWSAPPSSVPELATRLDEVTKALQSLHTEQQASAELIRSLAEHNAQLVDAFAIIRARVRLLLGFCVVLCVAFGAMVVWLAAR